MIRAIKMIENLRQLLEELLEVKISKEKEKERVENKFNFPKSLKLKAEVRYYKPHIILEIESDTPVLFSDQNFLRRLYEEAEPLVSISWIDVKASPKELEENEIPMEYVGEISGWKGKCGLIFGKNYFNQPIIHLQSNDGIRKRKKIVKALNLKIRSPYVASRLVEIDSKETKEKLIENLRKGFKMLGSTDERYIEIHFPAHFVGVYQDKMPAEKLPKFGKIYRIGLMDREDTNSLDFKYSEYSGKEWTTMRITKPPLLLEPQLKVLNTYKISPKPL